MTKKGTKKHTSKVVPDDDSRTVAFKVTYLQNGEPTEKTFDSRGELLAFVRGLATFMGTAPTAIVRTVTHTVTVED